MATPLMREYCDEVKRCREEFEEEVIVMMQVGSFYEVYQLEEVGHAKQVSELLGIALSRKANTADQPYMCGFPLYTLGKFITRLNDEGYIVAVYDQKPENVRERFRKGVYRPSLRIELEDNSNQENRLMCAVIESYKNGIERIKTTRFLISVSCIDVDTGRLCIKEVEVDDWTHLQNIVIKFQPSEVIYTANFSLDPRIFRCGHRQVNDQGDAGVLYKAFDIPGKEDPVQQLGLERYPSVAKSLITLLGFIERHDPCLMTKIRHPVWCDQESTYVEYNTDFFTEMNVLDIDQRRKSFVEKKKQKTLFDVLNHTKTIMGKRRLKEILRFPLCDPERLRQRAREIARHRGLGMDLEFVDLDWLNLRWKRKKASIQSVLTMVAQLEAFVKDVDRLQLHATISTTQIMDFLGKAASRWDLSGVERILRDPSPGLRGMQKDYDACDAQLKAFERELNYTNEQAFKLIRLDGLFYFQTTKKRWESVKKSELFTKYSCNTASSSCRIYTEELHTLARKMNHLEERITAKTFDEFNEQSQEILSSVDFDAICNTIAELDLWTSLADFFERSQYTEPSYTEGEASFVEGHEIRHPIIEQIDRDNLFVPHDVGMVDRGMLIFGINSSGKSTYLKSVGLCVWMAQCGLYVPAKDFRISPFKILMSKIGSFDNIYLGHSTFVAEMNELHLILRKSIPRRSLILCDELTSGTEIYSATGIVASTIDYLNAHGILFIITTHLHLLSKIKEIRDAVNIFHFTLETEKTTSLLIQDLRIRYNRKLKPSSGPETYGIEIASDMGMPKEFIRKASEIRGRIECHYGAEKKIKKSRYNKKLFLDKCFKCGSAQALHTHHITPQADFSKSTPHDKHGLYNLITLCEPCHHETHSASPTNL